MRSGTVHVGDICPHNKPVGFYVDGSGAELFLNRHWTFLSYVDARWLTDGQFLRAGGQIHSRATS